jgi:BlaI family penicillinase repressor
MRAVWSTVPATSSAIIQDLAAGTGWEPTTVKTLLARLVKKGAVRFEAQGRTYLYYPVLSEEACIRREMRLFAGKIYGGEIRLASPHFDFKGTDDPAFMDVLAVALEAGLSSLTADLQYQLTERLVVYVHPSRQRLQSALGVLDGPDWLRAGTIWGIIHLAPRDCFDLPPPDKAALHVLAQLLVSLVNPATPYWLSQAVAAWESQWLDQARISRTVQSRPAGFRLSDMLEVGAVYRQFREAGGYELAFTVAEFAVAEFGRDSLAKLVRLPNNFAAVFSISEAEFWQRWDAFLARRYA